MHNDPVNCVDLWGLTASDSEKSIWQKTKDYFAPAVNLDFGYDYGQAAASAWNNKEYGKAVLYEISGTLEMAYDLQLAYFCAKGAGVVIEIVKAAATAVPKLKNGDTVYRVYGEDSASTGASWTTTNPATVSDFRNYAGLPSGGESKANNSAQFVIEAIVEDASKCIESRYALPLDGNTGGAPEYIIPDAIESGAVKVINVFGINPEL